MSQLSLFDAAKTPAERRPVNVEIIRKEMRRVLYVARRAEYMPWSEHEAASWERRFPELAAYLAPEEGTAMLAEFRTELARLRAARDE